MNFEINMQKNSLLKLAMKILIKTSHAILIFLEALLLKSKVLNYKIRENPHNKIYKKIFFTIVL